METGTIKNMKLGYGFITREDGSDIFFHISQFESEGEPESGMAVTFEIGERNGKSQAQHVKLIE